VAKEILLPMLKGSAARTGYLDTVIISSLSKTILQGNGSVQLPALQHRTKTLADSVRAGSRKGNKELSASQ